MHSVGINGVSLPNPPLSNQEWRTDIKDEDEVGVEAIVRTQRIRPVGMSIPNGSQGSASPLKELEIPDVGYASGDGQSPFRPTPESWANATTEALAHLRLSGLIVQVPEVPHSAPTPSLPTIVVTSPSPVSSSRVMEAHSERVAPGVSLYSPSSTKKKALTPPSRQIQSQKSNKPVRYYLPEPDSPISTNGSTNLSSQQAREKKPTHQKVNFAIYSPISRSDHLAEHDGNGDQKPALPRAPTRPYQFESDPGHSTTRQIDPPADPLWYAPRSVVPGSISEAPSYTSHLSATHKNERQGSLIGHETGYTFPVAPSHRPGPFLSAPQPTPQNHHRYEYVRVMERGVQELRRDDDPSNLPPFGITQSLGRAPAAALNRSQNYQEKRDFLRAPHDDLWAYEMSSSPAPGLPPAIGPSYGTQNTWASHAPLVQPEDRSSLPKASVFNTSPYIIRKKLSTAPKLLL
jgi:hypothetical protein